MTAIPVAFSLRLEKRLKHYRYCKATVYSCKLHMQTCTVQYSTVEWPVCTVFVSVEPDLSLATFV